jgi:stage V sporulation protein B
LSQDDIVQRSLRGSFALFAGNFVSTALSFVAILFIARLLGPDSYGVYTLCVLIPSLLLNFLGFGVTSGITRYAALYLSRGRPDVARRMTVNGAVFVIVFGVALAAIDLGTAGFTARSLLHRPEIEPLIQFASVFILVQAAFQSGVAALLGWSYMGRISGTTIVQGALRLAVVVPLLYLGYQVYGALAAYAISVGLGGLLAFYLLWQGMRGTKSEKGHFFSDVKTLLSYGRELFVGTFVTNISSQYVVLILAIIASNTYVGFYQSAANFVTAITITSGAIAQALFPAFAHLEGTKADVGRAFTLATKYMGFAIAPVIFLLMSASVQLIRLPLGSSYSAAAFFLTLLAFSNVSLIFGHGVLPSFFNGLGKPRYYMVFSLAGSGVIFALAPLLGIFAGFGVYGLIVSTLVANMVGVSVGIYLASRFFQAYVDGRACVSIVATSVLAFVVVSLLSSLSLPDAILLPVEVVVFAAVYLSAAPLLRAISPEDLDILRSALDGLGRFKVILLPILNYERWVLRIAGRK